MASVDWLGSNPGMTFASPVAGLGCSATVAGDGASGFAAGVSDAAGAAWGVSPSLVAFPKICSKVPLEAAGRELAYLRDLIILLLIGSTLSPRRTRAALLPLTNVQLL